jgi:hypothetical protein
MEGKEGPPTAEDLAEARKQMLSSKSATGDVEKQKKDLEKSLPSGVTLLDASTKEDGLKMAVNLLFGFDNVSKLAAIAMPKGPVEGPGAANPVDSPFDGLVVKDEGATILVTTKALNPMADVKEQAPSEDPAMAKQIMGLFAGLRVAFKITAPFTVLEHNAHRKDGNTLIWEFTLESLSKLTPEQLSQGIRVRYQK